MRFSKGAEDHDMIKPLSHRASHIASFRFLLLLRHLYRGRLLLPDPASLAGGLPHVVCLPRSTISEWSAKAGSKSIIYAPDSKAPWP